MLSINSNILRPLINNYSSIKELSSAIKCTEVELDTWLNKECIPPRKLCEIVKKLDLSLSETSSIVKPQLNGD